MFLRASYFGSRRLRSDSWSYPSSASPSDLCCLSSCRTKYVLRTVCTIYSPDLTCRYTAFTPRQHIAVRILTTATSAVTIAGLVLAAMWFFGERWVSREYQGARWLMDILSAHMKVGKDWLRARLCQLQPQRQSDDLPQHSTTDAFDDWISLSFKRSISEKLSNDIVIPYLSKAPSNGSTDGSIRTLQRKFEAMSKPICSYEISKSNPVFALYTSPDGLDVAAAR